MSWTETGETGGFGAQARACQTLWWQGSTHVTWRKPQLLICSLLLGCKLRSWCTVCLSVQWGCTEGTGLGWRHSKMQTTGQTVYKNVFFLSLSPSISHTHSYLQAPL